MSRITKVNGDYRLQVASGGNIFLDTSNSGASTIGTVTVYGDLQVVGNVSYVQSTNTEIKDTILQLNYGQTGSGIGNGVGDQVSGIEIERGSLSAAQILFSETTTHYDPVTSSTVAGTFVFRTANGTLSGIQAASIANAGTTDFVFDMQNNPYVLRVANASSYATNISSPNDIPNVQYLYNYVAANNGVATVDRIFYPTGSGIGNATSSIEAYASSVVFQISQTTKAVISAAGLTVNNVNLFGDTISDVGSNNLVLTASNNVVELNAVMQLDNQTTTPSYTSSGTIVYASNTVGPGNTGIYFTSANAAQTPDELVSRRRAVALSILL
jgi:hypothetical protein